MRNDAVTLDRWPPFGMRVSTRTKIIVVSLLLLLAGWNLYANSKDPADHNLVDRSVLFVTSPVQKAVTWVFRGIGEGFGGYVDLVGVERRNRELEALLDGWDALEARNAELEGQNRRLRELAGLRERMAVPTVGAEVIGWSTSSRFRTVRIDRGRSDGLQPGLAVIGPAGVVGQVLDTSGGSADVLLLSDASSGLGGRLQRTRIRGIVAGNGRWGARLDFVSRQESGAVAQGDLVVTSGDDGVFPGGLPVGRVSEVRTEATGQFLSVEIEPAQPLASLEEVLVLLDPAAALPEDFEFDPTTVEDPALLGLPEDAR